MDNYERCGMFRCGGFRTSLPAEAKGKTLFEAYLRSIGYPNGEGLTLYGDKVGIYTIKEESGNQNTEVDVNGDFDTILIGVRHDESWDIYEVDKSIIEAKDRGGVISLNKIQNKIKENKARKINV